MKQTAKQILIMADSLANTIRKTNVQNCSQHVQETASTRFTTRFHAQMLSIQTDIFSSMYDTI